MALCALGPLCCADTPQSPRCHSMFSFCKEESSHNVYGLLPDMVQCSHRGSGARVGEGRLTGLEAGLEASPHSNDIGTVHSSCSGLFQPSTSWGLQAS